jgi:hypothetical protein
MMKLALMRTVTGKEDPELPLLQRISSLELTAPPIAVVERVKNFKFPGGHITKDLSWSKHTNTVMKRA